MLKVKNLQKYLKEVNASAKTTEETPLKQTPYEGPKIINKEETFGQLTPSNILEFLQHMHFWGAIIC